MLHATLDVQAGQLARWAVAAQSVSTFCKHPLVQKGCTKGMGKASRLMTNEMKNLLFFKELLQTAKLCTAINYNAQHYVMIEQKTFEPHISSALIR